MKWLGYREMRVSAIFGPGDTKQRMAAPHVQALADNIKALGDEPQNAPVIQAGTSELISGRDRFAATLINKRKKLWVHVAEATDAEKADMEESENLYRRPVPNRDELIARRVAKVAEVLRLTQRAGGSTAPLAEQTIKADARKQVAAEAGVTPSAVKSAEKRVREKLGASPDHVGEDGEGQPRPSHNRLPETTQAGASPSDPTPPADLPPGFDRLGMDVPSVRARAVMVVSVALEAIDKALRGAQGEITSLEKSYHLSGVQAQALRQALHDAAHAVRETKPATVCGYCKDVTGQAGRRATCVGCMALGWLSAEQARAMPAEMRREGSAACVSVDGKIVAATAPKRKPARVEQAAKEAVEVTAPRAPDEWTPPPKRPPPRNRIVIEREDGSEVPFIDADEAP